jgi:hypothetical protein
MQLIAKGLHFTDSKLNFVNIEILKNRVADLVSNLLKKRKGTLPANFLSAFKDGHIVHAFLQVAGPSGLSEIGFQGQVQTAGLRPATFLVSGAYFNSKVNSFQENFVHVFSPENPFPGGVAAKPQGWV